MNLNQLKLSSKLGMAFAVLILLTLVVGSLGIVQMARINDNTTDIAANRLPSIRTLAAVRAAANQIRRAEPDHLLSLSDAEMDDIDKRLASGKDELTKQEAAYAGLIATPEERTLFEEMQKARGAFLATQPKLLELSRGGEKTFDQAKAYFRGESRQAYNAYSESIQRAIDYNDKGSEVSYATAQAVYAQARGWAIGLMATSVLLAVALALLLLRNVNRQLGSDPQEAAALARRVAQGDLGSHITLRPGDTSSLMAALKDMQDSLAKVVATVRQGSESVASASAQIATGNADLSARTEQQASALEETAASMEELGSTVRQNADNARTANQLAMNASTVAQQGGDVVAEVVDTMKGINDSSRKIADIISVIDGIAFQTNILALNAAVEAARAGEQGRGFAVVAGEVRTLAQRSAEAAKEIKSLITASVERVEQGSTLVDKAGVTMTEVVGAIRRVTDIMGEISAASSEQSAGVAQVGEAVTQMDQATQQNAALVEEMAAAAASLRSQAGELVNAVAVFQLGAGSHHRAAVAAPVAMAAPPAPARVAKAAPKPARLAPAAPAALKPTPKAAPKADDAQGDWESF
jgi:methyl-accepting chemotaxis protein